MLRVLSIFGTVAVLGVAAVLGALALPACGVAERIAPRWFDWCPTNQQAVTEARLAALTAHRVALEADIIARERDLALYPCVAAVPEPPSEVALAPEPLPEPALDPIDPEAWTARDIGLLEGCWDLDSRFTTTDPTGKPSTYQVWQMCFDASGQGREEMRSDSGSVCSGPVTGRFPEDGQLLIEEPADLQCSDGGYIYRLESRCTLTGDGTAKCEVRQPEVGTATVVDFRRSSRRP